MVRDASASFLQNPIFGLKSLLEWFTPPQERLSMTIENTLGNLTVTVHQSGIQEKQKQRCELAENVGHASLTGSLSF